VPRLGHRLMQLAQQIVAAAPCNRGPVCASEPLPVRRGDFRTESAAREGHCVVLGRGVGHRRDASVVTDDAGGRPRLRRGAIRPATFAKMPPMLLHDVARSLVAAAFAVLAFPADSFAAPASAEASASAPGAVPSGEYVLIQQFEVGSLQVSGSGFSIETVGGNCHVCSIDGLLSGNEGFAGEGETACHFKTTVGPGSVRIETPEDSEGCRTYCGMRASFNGEYRMLPAACTDKARASRLEQARLAYREREYAKARTDLRALISDCGQFTDWITLDRERNELALAELRAGDAAQCLKVLAQTRVAGADDEAGLDLSPCDKDAYLDVAKSTWHNRKLCKALGADAGKVTGANAESSSAP
jgi:hypothetical protein